MLKSNRPDASVLLLMDILLGILVFAICASISLLIFAKADTLTDSSAEETYAVTECDNISEILRASSSKEQFLSLMQQYYPDMQKDNNTMTIYYDASFQPVSSHPVYTMTITLDTSSTLCKAHILYSSDHKTIYEESTSHLLSEAVS
jgi:hypothetical protein